ncbi:MAG TPA: hypothetical protein VIM98_08675 [Dyella sp.]|uniref:hypothetical protein n=1 Tax=Dyella sp. TaxID=1869338 RepID=UPI002F944CC4
MSNLSAQRLHHFIAPLLLLLTAAVFWPAVYGGFIFDDYPIFAENAAVHVSGFHWQEWQRVWDWAHLNIERPLAMLTYALNYALGNSTLGFKVTNLCIHVINALLVLILARQLLRVARNDATRSNLNGEKFRDFWAFGTAAVWALHPLQVSAVMYVVQRMELLGFTFTLLALLSYWHARQRQIRGQRGWPWLILSALLTAVGYGAKETIVLVPGYALLLELTLLQFAAAQARTSLLWRVFFATGCVVAVLGFVGYLLPHYANAGMFFGRDYTAWERELTQLRALPMYIGWSLLPLPSHLVFYYDDYPVSTGLLHPITTLYGGIFLVALLALAMFLRKRRPLIALGIGWFFMAHLLTSSPLPLELVFEHRNYPALFGLALAIVDAFRWLAQRIKSPVPAAIGIVLIANLCFLTTLRSLTWSSPFLLAQTLAEYNPGSQRAAMDLARRFMAMSGGNPDSPLYSLCIRELERAAQLPLDAPLPEEALLLISAQHPDRPSTPWWDSIDRKLRTRPMVPDTYRVLHTLMRHRLDGVTGIDAQRLAQAYAIAAERNPNRQSLQVDYAELAGGALHDPELATVHWRNALKLDSNPANYGPRLADYLVSQQRYREANGVIEATWELSPATRNDHALSALKDKALRSMQQGSATGPQAATE